MLADSLAVRDGLIAANGLTQLLQRAPRFEYRQASTLFMVLMLELWLRLVARRTDSMSSLRDAIGKRARSAPEVFA